MKHTTLILAIILAAFCSVSVSHAEENAYSSALEAWRNLIDPEKCRTMLDKKGAGSALVPMFLDSKIIRENSEFLGECDTFGKTARKLNRKYGLEVGALIYKTDFELEKSKFEKSPLSIHFKDSQYKMRVVQTIFDPSHESDPNMQRKGLTFFLRCTDEFCQSGELVGFDDVIKKQK